MLVEYKVNFNKNYDEIIDDIFVKSVVAISLYFIGANLFATVFYFYKTISKHYYLKLLKKYLQYIKKL